MTKTSEVFEVEKIVGHKITKNSRLYTICYEIKWAGYGNEHNTIEREANVYAHDMIVKYWKSLPKDNPDRVLFEKIQSRRKNPIELSPPKPKKKAPEKKPAPKRLPVVIANENATEDEDEDEDEEVEKNTETNNNTKNIGIKRKGPYCSDYFLEEHERKRQIENDALEKNLAEHVIDWKSLAESVEYIGKESPEDTHYHCRVKWKDGVRTMHPLSVVRIKRPDLVIDRFIKMAEESGN